MDYPAGKPGNKQFLMQLNIVKEPLNMYRFRTTLVGRHSNPFLIIAVYNSVDKLDKSLVEASYDLGANRWKTLKQPCRSQYRVYRRVYLVFIPSLGMSLYRTCLAEANNFGQFN